MSTETATTNPGRRILNRNHEARDLIDLRMPFTNKTGSYTGELVTLPEGAAWLSDQRDIVGYGTDGRPRVLVYVGNLPEPFAALLAGQITDGAGRTLYVVRSYGTIVAWSFAPPALTPGQPYRADPGRVWVPNVRHTQTTGNHQHVCLQARGAEWHTIAGAAVA